MGTVPMFGCWGWLPLAVPLAAFIAAGLGVLAVPAARASDRLLAGAVLLAVLLLLLVRALGLVHLLAGVPLLVALLVIAGALAFALRTSSRCWPLAPKGLLARRESGGWFARLALPPWRDFATPSTAPLLVAAAAAVALATLAAYWLPVWQWDALGYHLPYVNFALVGRGFDAIPGDMPYVSTYPHNVETLIIVLRALLPDDRLVDLAEIPFAALGGAATAGIARRYGATRGAALAAGAAWVVMPAVFVQMPTDYVDVACAAFFLAAAYFIVAVSTEPEAPRELARRRLVLGGLALGLYLGTKPNAPVSTAIVGALLLWAGFRARARAIAALALGEVAIVGGGTFVYNALRYRNPVWPVTVTFGPFVLRGTTAMQHLLDSGAAAPHLHGSLLSRVVRSWTAIGSPPVFDMRIGGFGPLVLLALPVALVTLARRKDLLAWGLLGASIAAPDPSVARYVLGLPALLLAFAASRAGLVPPRARPWLGAAAGLAACWQLVYVWRGLAGEGPPVFAYASMTVDERAAAVGANGSPVPFIELRKRVGDGETFAFDQGLDLPYLAWESDLRYRAAWISDSLAIDAVDGFLTQQNVRVAVVAEGSPTGQWLARNPERFLKLFPCKSAPCSVFARR